MTGLQKVRMSTGLRGTTHCISWVGTQAGIFAKHGIEVEFPTFEVGGPESVAGLVRGEWDFVQTGTVPMAEHVLNGHDSVILLRNCFDHLSTYIMTPPEVKSLQQLSGRKVGVLTDAYHGQTGVITRRTLEAAGVEAEYVGLGTYLNIFAGLADGKVDAAALPVELRYAGASKHGWNAFETVPYGLPSIFGTTRGMIARERALVVRVVQAMLESIHLFKTRADIVVPILQEFLRIEERAVAEDIHGHYVDLFPPVPRPDLERAMPALHQLFSPSYPAGGSLRETDIADPSFLDELERSGFVKHLYGAAGHA
jgi:ABC-type nitrate/sulfonate/bicarbonate transport system substrate-binding protein